MTSRYVQYSWDLSKLAPPPENGTHPGRIREAEKSEAEIVWAVYERSLISDPAWSVGLQQRLKELRHLIDDGMETGQASFLVIHSGERFIGASGLCADPGIERQLLTGIHVVNEYRCRGQGSRLLAASLSWLKEHGVSKALSITREGVAADRFLYPKFGGVRTVLSSVPPLPKFVKKK
jgi:GNAT superfamily N-acetyltransferase